MSLLRDIWTNRATDPRPVVLLAVVLFGWNLWGYDLWAPNEPYFGEGAREMVVDGEWLVPHVNGEVTTDKPPVFFWLIALCSLPFDSVSSLTARLPSVLAALGSLLLTIRLGRRTSGARTAVLAGAMLVTMHMFWDKARSAQIDSLLCFLILVAVSALEAFRAGDWSGRRAGLVFWSACALATLAKGPVGLLLPLGIALVTLAFDRQLHRWRALAPITGPLTFLAITGLWAATATLWDADYSVFAALREHFVDRAIHGMHHKQPFWYYLKVLPAVLVPWGFLFPGALVLAWRRRQEADRLLLVAALFVVPQGITGAVMILAAVAAPFVAPRYGDELMAPAIALAAVLGVGGGGALVMAIRGLALRSVHWSGAAMAAGMLVAAGLVLPHFNPVKSGRELGVAVREATAESRAAGSSVLVLTSSHGPPEEELINVVFAVNFYSDGVYLQEVANAEELIAELSVGETRFLLANEAVLPPLPEELLERMSVVYSTRLSRKDLKLYRFGASRSPGMNPRVDVLDPKARASLPVPLKRQETPHVDAES